MKVSVTVIENNEVVRTVVLKEGDSIDLKDAAELAVQWCEKHNVDVNWDGPADVYDGMGREGLLNYYADWFAKHEGVCDTHPYWDPEKQCYSLESRWEFKVEAPDISNIRFDEYEYGRLKKAYGVFEPHYWIGYFMDDKWERFYGGLNDAIKHFDARRGEHGNHSFRMLMEP